MGAASRRTLVGRVLVVPALAVPALALSLGACAPAPAAAPPPPPQVVTVEAPVDVAKAQVPAPEPRPDLSALTVVDPLHVVPGLPGLDGLTQLENDDPTAGRWRTAVVTRDTAAYDAPGGTAVGRLPAYTLGVPTTVPVVEVGDEGWLRVMVAARGALPSDDATQVNGRTAWVRAFDTRPAGTDWRIEVSTHDQTVTIDEGDGPTTYAVIATGAPSRPTPRAPQFVVGTFWDQPGTYTPRVVLLSSQSETIDAYDRETGTSATAFHTTPLRGRGEISNGCIRLSDDVLDVLWHRVPAGTLVLVS
ncbi:L,D-transpeptidase [Cellulomonas composti]|uniref:L,D-TPase catalytic domain-containing protein n=1 Tax=Cellulomonas composti TaxID=266130 RepID=A0A511J7L8_9CELL|nr:L,D-transpeptidase [Cellulomonas composti]GEL93978.1 hypothetical protein CCO02nite_06360 [Cellulomonas composti]